MHFGRLGQRVKFFTDSSEEQFPISPWQIPPAHPAGKKHIPPEKVSAFPMPKTQAARTMPRHVQHIKNLPAQVLAGSLFQEQVWLDGLDFEGKPIPTEGLAVVDQRHGIRMNPARAPVVPQNSRRIHHMIKVPVRQQKQVNFFPGKVFRRALRSINQDVARSIFQKKTVRFKDSARKFFEL
jgi:hypothetical protein